jgi:hypothetical protein
MAVMLGSCAITPGTEIYTADGSKARLISCGPEWENFTRALASTPSGNPNISGGIAEGFAKGPPPKADWGRCLSQASTVCGARGYTVLESVPEIGRMVIQCKV